MKKLKDKCKHIWNDTYLFGDRNLYLYRFCLKCGKSQKAKVIFRDYKQE